MSDLGCWRWARTLTGVAGLWLVISRWVLGFEGYAGARNAVYNAMVRPDTSLDGGLLAATTLVLGNRLAD